MNSTRPQLREMIDRLAVGAVTIVYLVHFAYVWRYAVDVPYRDDWDACEPGGMSRAFDLQWLFARHNEHRIVLTKLQTWLLYRVNDWNVASQQLMNFAIFGVVIVLAGVCMRRIDRSLPRFVVAACLLPLMSAACHENHAWAFQSQFHLFVLLFMAAALLLVHRRVSGRSTAMGILCLVLCAYSFSAGVACAAVLIVGSSAHYLVRRQAAAKWAPWTIAAMVLIGLWFVGYQSVGDHPDVALPHCAAFWSMLCHVVSLGFGFERPSLLLGVVCLILVLTPVWLASRHAIKGSTPHMLVTVLIVGILAAICAIAVGRGGFGEKMAKSSRFTGIAMMLVPFAAAGWHLALRSRRRWRVAVITALWLIACVGHLDNWNYDDVYRRYARTKMKGIRCLYAYYMQVNVMGRRPLPQGPYCRALFPRPLQGRFDRAGEMRISFYQRLEQAVESKLREAVGQAAAAAPDSPANRRSPGTAPPRAP